MRARRGILSAAVVAAALVLSACAGLPTSGPVNPGLQQGEGADGKDVVFLPDEPEAGADPVDIVKGFIAAATSPAGDWRIARMFLAPGIRDSWKPTANVTIDDLVDRSYTEGDGGEITLAVSAVAAVDDTGAYQSTTDAGPSTLPFHLEKQSNGEWRITETQDGIVLDRESFGEVFHAYSLMYFDPTWTYLVPDVRWFVARNSAVSIVLQLVQGSPSPWLAGAAASAFPDGTTALSAVPIASGVAQVSLSDGALGTPQTTLDRMQTQLAASLATAGAGISSVEMTVDGVEVPASVLPTRSTRVDARPAVVVKAGFGLLTGADDLESLPGLSGAMAGVDAIAVELSPDRDFAGVRLGDGSVAVVRSGKDLAVLDTRPGLVNPTVDGSGYVWAVPRDAPASVTAYAPDGTALPIADAWTGASRIVAMQLSRDGARVVALVESGGRAEAWVAGVVRDAHGVPSRLGEPVRLAVLSGSAVDVAWLDDASVGAVSATDGHVVVLTQQVGGSGAEAVAPAGITTIAGSNPVGAVRLRSSEGDLFIRRGTTWQRTASGVVVLATQQGAPR